MSLGMQPNIKLKEDNIPEKIETTGVPAAVYGHLFWARRVWFQHHRPQQLVMLAAGCTRT